MRLRRRPRPAATGKGCCAALYLCACRPFPRRGLQNSAGLSFAVSSSLCDNLHPHFALAAIRLTRRGTSRASSGAPPRAGTPEGTGVDAEAEAAPLARDKVGWRFPPRGFDADGFSSLPLAAQGYKGMPSVRTAGARPTGRGLPAGLAAEGRSQGSGVRCPPRPPGVQEAGRLTGVCTLGGVFATVPDALCGES